MKKIINALSWMACIVIMIACSLASIGGGAYVANYCGDFLGIHSFVLSLVVLTPIMFVVAMGICVFLTLGLRKFGGAANS